MSIEKERFDQIMAVVLANLVDDFKGLAAVPSRETVHGTDVSDYGGFAGGLMSGANVTWGELGEFADEFTSRFKMGEVSPNIAKIQSESDEKIQNVVDDILERARKYGFTPNKATASDLIAESSSLLDIPLRNDEQRKAIEMLLDVPVASPA